MSAPQELTCTLCGSDNIVEQFTIENRTFFECPICDLLFVHPEEGPSPDQEIKRYTCHNNNLQDSGYLGYLSRIVDRVRPALTTTARGLDFGCGPTQALTHLFRRHNIILEGYDPFFGPPLPTLSSQYDFITCAEVAEHFRAPLIEFKRMRELIRPGGTIAIMTNFREGDRRTPSWWYLRDITHRSFYSQKTFEVLGTMLQWTLSSVSNNIAVFQS